jgi:hypothetical protein
MSLRCRPGDLCVVVRDAWAREGNLELPPGVDFKALKAGTVVRVVLHDGEQWIFEKPVPYHAVVSGWECSGVVEAAADEYLQPLRDQPGPDETLAWAGAPRRAQADAVVSITPLVPAYPAAALSSLSGRGDFALGLPAGGSFLPR